jgi:mycothiol synthase
MTESPYTIRNYRPADFNFFVLLYQEAERQEPIGRPATPQAIAEKLSRPNYAPEKDLFVVAKTGDIVGFMDIVPELGIERVIVDGWLRPEHRRKGLGKKLLGFAGRRARKLGASFLHVNVNEANAAGRNALAKLGFAGVRRFLELHLDLTRADKRELDRAFGGCRHLREGEEETLTQIQNISFAEHWGYNPNTVATIAYRLSLSHRSPKDIILTCEEEEVTGYCWTEVTPSGEGRIYMIGSVPGHRGRGIGRKLLLAGLANLKNRGVNEVWLTADSENQAAVSLYKSMGFQRRKTYLWYEKSVV